MNHHQAYYKTQNQLSSDGIIYLDNTFHIVEVNKKACAIFESSPNYKTLFDWTGDEKLFKIAKNIVAEGLEITSQLNHNGYVFMVRATAVYDNNHPIGVVIILEDVSELQRLWRARHDFVANISHDLRTPIADARLMAETLLNGALEDHSMAPRLVSKILEEMETLEQITQELMDLSMIESGRIPLKLIPINLYRLVNTQMERFRPKAMRKGLNLNLAIPADLNVLADNEFITRVFANLIHNATKFTSKGKITVGAEIPHGNDFVRITVTDTGIGIPKQDQTRIFERFFKSDYSRSKHAGTGLGLAIAKHIVEAHGGQIGVDSQLKKRTTIYFTLPLA